jgi:hypothetical protein
MSESNRVKQSKTYVVKIIIENLPVSKDDTLHKHMAVVKSIKKRNIITFSKHKLSNTKIKLKRKVYKQTFVSAHKICL